MGYNKPKVMQAKKVRGWWQAHENIELEKGSRKPKESKWAKDAQKEINGTKEPTSNVIQNPNDHIESLREE